MSRLRFTCVGLFTAAVSCLALHAGDNLKGIKHVLLISVDGMHELDYLNCIKGTPGVNNGQPWCLNIAKLGADGVNYTETSTSRPSDSFPGLMAIVSGGGINSIDAQKLPRDKNCKPVYPWNFVRTNTIFGVDS